MVGGGIFCPCGGMADATDLKSVDCNGRGGSSPPVGSVESTDRQGHTPWLVIAEIPWRSVFVSGWGGVFGCSKSVLNHFTRISGRVTA